MVSIQNGFRDDERSVVCDIYWQAFGAKLGKVLGPKQRAMRFLCPLLNPDFALIARSDTGAVLGVAGFKTERGSLLGGDFRDLARVYGRLGALWRGAILAMLERKVQPGVFQMDGLCVDASARGIGLGTQLLNAVFDEARQRNLTEVQLDVIDTNPRAKALYERRGFESIGVSGTGPLRHVLGFLSATTMRRTV